MSPSCWKAFEEGLTLGRPGSERGRIVRDDDYADAARITLERDCPTALFALTCAVYGWWMHTRYFTDLDGAEAEYEHMKRGLAAIVAMIPDVNAPDLEKQLRIVAAAIRNLTPQPPSLGGKGRGGGRGREL